MKMTKKKVFVTALVISLVAIISMGTLAWFSDSKSVNNEFFIASTDDDTADEVFSVKLEETEAGPYKEILPGDTLDKNPTIYNTGHYDQYIRVTIKITNAKNFVDYIAGGSSTLTANVFPGFVASNWESDDNFNGNYDQNTDEITYVLYYNGILESNQYVRVFTDVVIPEGLTRDQAAKFNEGDAANSFSINIKADAVQTQNVGAVSTATDAANAKTAFTTVGM